MMAVNSMICFVSEFVTALVENEVMIGFVVVVVDVVTIVVVGVVTIPSVVSVVT